MASTPWREAQTGEIGGLHIKKGTHIENLLHGGQQENNLRPGTENVPYIVGFTKALEEGMKTMFPSMIRQNEYIKYFLNELDKNEIKSFHSGYSD